MKWKFLDHGAHLGGTMTGLTFWYLYSKYYGTSHSIKYENNDLATDSNGNGNDNDNVSVFKESKEIDMDSILPCFRSRYVFYGNFENLKPCDEFGTFYAPNRTYCGEIGENRFIFNGKGCLRNEANGSVFYGYFINGKVMN